MEAYTIVYSVDYTSLIDFIDAEIEKLTQGEYIND
jgi:hypothetical protein